MILNRRVLIILLCLAMASSLHAANRYWISVLGGNWNSTSSWSTSSGGGSGASVPGSGDVAVFDGGFLGIEDGTCTINATVNIAGLSVTSSYLGTITQGANTMTIGGAATFGGGTFTGGSSNITITGDFTLSGTTFTSTTATMELQGNAAFTTGSFANNNGQTRFNGAAAESITGTSPTFYTLEFAGTGHSYTISSTGNVGVTNSLIISGVSSCTLNTGTLAVSGNISLTNTSTSDGGTATINITGASAQSISSALAINQSTLPNVTINKSGGTLTLPALITEGGNWTYTAGTIDAATNNSTVVFTGTLNITGSHTLKNISFEGNNNWTYTLGAGTTLTANGDVSLTGTGNLIFSGGTINLNGNLNLTNTSTGGGGTTVMAFIASTNQSIISALAVNQSSLPAVTINKSAGTLTFPAMLTSRNNWTYTAGTIDATTNSSTVVFAAALGSGAMTIAGSQTLDNVTLEGNNNNTISVATGTVLTVAGTLSTTGASNVFINTPVTAATAIQAQGDITVNNTSTSGGGTGLILINGTGSQSLTGNSPSGKGLLPYITIQKASGTLSIAGTISTMRDWKYTSGTVNAGTSTVVFGGNSLSVTSVGMSFYNFTAALSTITLATALTVTNNLTISGSAVLAGGSRTINLGGNWSNYGTAGFTEATSTVNFNGSALQTITTPGGENFTNFTVNNSSAGIQLVNNARVATGLTLTQGNIDLNSNTLTLGTAALTPGTLNFTAGSMINAGTFTRWVGAAAISGSAGLFPMGSTTNYHPFSVSTSAAPTTGGTISLSYTDATTNSVVTFSDGASIVTIRKDLHWTGSTGGTLAGGTYNAAISGTGYGSIGNTADLRLTLANSSIGSAGTNGGTNSNPIVNTSGLALADLGNAFYLSSVDNNLTALPVTLISFTGSVVNGGVVLDWSTGDESNNASFTVQRSKDGAVWENVVKIAAAGTVTGHHYTARDANPYSGLGYYRLVQTDINGKETYSFIISVEFRSVSGSVTVYPNPAVKTVAINFPSAGTYEVSLYNSAGQLVIGPRLSKGNSMIIPVDGLNPGIYYIRLQHQGIVETKEVMVTK